jgi:hypothetical protein
MFRRLSWETGEKEARPGGRVNKGIGWGEGEGEREEGVRRRDLGGGSIKGLDGEKEEGGRRKEGGREEGDPPSAIKQGLFV